MTVKCGKRGAALALSAAMLFGMLPVGALAADEDISVTVPEVQESSAPAGEPDGADILPPESGTVDGPDKEEAGDATPAEGEQKDHLEEPEDFGEPEMPVLLLDAEAELLGIDLDELYTDEVFASEDEYADGMDFLRKTFNSYDIFSLGDFLSQGHITSVIAANGDVEIGGDIGPYVGAESGMVYTNYIGGTLVSAINQNFSNAGDGTRRLYLNPENNIPVSLEGDQFKYTVTGKRKTLVLSERIAFGLSSEYVDFDRAAAALEDASDALTRACADKVVTVEMVKAAIRGENPGFPEGVGYTVKSHYTGLDIQVGTAVTLEDGVLAALKEKRASLNLVPDSGRTLDNTATWITVEGAKIKFDEVAYGGQQYVSNNWCDPVGFGDSMGLVWNLPQAKSVGFTGVTDYFGHMLALGAKVTTQSGGNLDGDVICAAFKGKGASCHTWGYLPDSEPEVPEVPEVQTFTLNVQTYVEGAELSALDGESFQITVAGPEDFQAVLRPETAETGDCLSWKLEQLTPGVYTLTESGYEISGMEFDGSATTWNGTAAGTGPQIKVTIGSAAEGAGPVQAVAFTNRYSEPVPVMVTVVHRYDMAIVTEPEAVYSEDFVPEIKSEYQGEKYTLIRQEGPLADQNGNMVITLYYEKYTVEKQIIVVHDYGMDGSVSEAPVPYTDGFQAVQKNSFQGERYTLVKQEAPIFNGHGDIVIVLCYERYVEMKNVVVVHDYGTAGTLYEDPAPYVEGFQPGSKTTYRGVEYTLASQDGPSVNGNGDFVFVLHYAPVNQGGGNGGGSNGGHEGNDQKDPVPVPDPVLPEEETAPEMPETDIADAETPLAPVPENTGSDVGLAGGGIGATGGEPAEDKMPADGQLGEERSAEERPSETGMTVIAESGIPTGNLPQTGTVAAPSDPTATLGLLALAAALALAGLGVLTLRKRECGQ